MIIMKIVVPLVTLGDTWWFAVIVIDILKLVVAVVKVKAHGGCAQVGMRLHSVG